MKITDKNRQDIIEQYCHDIIDGMDWDSLYTFAYESLVEKKSLINDKDLEKEIIDYCPYILEH